jgi:hypothetical protein
MYDCSNFVYSCRIFGMSGFIQFKLIVKMTRIKSGVTIPKGLFTLYLNVKKVTAKNFGRHSTMAQIFQKSDMNKQNYSNRT